MDNLRGILKQRKIMISLRIFELQDLANGWEIKALVENRDVFNEFYSKHSIGELKNFDEYYIYLLSLKFQSFRNLIPMIIDDEHKNVAKSIADAAESALSTVSNGSVIKYINDNIEKIFGSEESDYDIRLVTLDIIAKYNTGIKKETFAYLCEHYGYLLVDRFDEFENTFEDAPELFDSLFPTGALDEIHPFRFESVLDIWRHILKKGKSNLKDIVNRNIAVLYEDIVSLSKTTTIDNVMQTEGTIRKFHQFLQGIQSPLANDFSKYAKSTESLLSQNIAERGQSFKFEIPVDEIIKRWKAISNWEIRLLNITHDPISTAGLHSFESRLNKRPEGKTSLMDLVSTNIPTDDYFTMSHQQKLSILSSVGTGTLLGIIRDPANLADYLSLISSAIAFIAEHHTEEQAELNKDSEMLTSMVQLLINNHDAKREIVASLCYGLSMFISAFSEKLLRLFYLSLIKDRLYVPINKATLGELLSVSNKEIIDVFGEDHVKALSFFLMQTPQRNIGYNFRNRLAHWSDITVSLLSLPFVAQLLWIFTDILNTIFWYYLKDSLEGD